MVAKSCTTLDYWNPTNNGMFTIYHHLSTGDSDFATIHRMYAGIMTMTLCIYIYICTHTSTVFPQLSNNVSAQATTSAVMVTPAILRTRKVDPLGVPKLVAHEVQIALVPWGVKDGAWKGPKNHGKNIWVEKTWKNIWVFRKIENPQNQWFHQTCCSNFEWGYPWF